MAKKYWWEEDENQSTTQKQTQAGQQPQSQEKKTYWWEPESVATTIGNDISSRVNDWLKKHNTYISGYQNRYSGRKYNYEDAYVSDSASWLDSVSKQRDSLKQEALGILDYVNQYKDYLDADWVNEITETLRSGRKQQKQVVEGATNDNEYWSKFANEDDYKAYAAQEKSYYDEWGHYAEEEDFDSTSANRNFVNPSDEDLTYYDAMMDYNSWRTDADGKMYDAFGNAIPYVADEKGNIIHPMQDDERFVVNDPLGLFLATSQDARSEIVYGGEQTGKKFDVIREGVDNHWEQINEDETSMYYYLMNTQGKDVAMEYLRDTAEKLNARWGKLKAEEISNIDNGFEKFVITGLFGLHAGVDQWGSGVAQVLNGEAYPTSGMQYASSEIANSLDGVGKYAYQAATTVGNMLPSILISRGLGMSGLAAGAAGKKIVKGVGAVTMGASAGGNAYAQALKEGYSEGQARTYGTLVGASEALLEYLIGGITDLGGIGTEKLLSKVSAIDKALLRIPAKLGIKIGDEILEEELQNFLEPAFRSIIFGEDYDAPTIDELIETALVTAMSTGFLEGGNTIAGDVAETQKYRDAGRTIMGAEGGVDALKQLANEVAGVSDAKMNNTLTKQVKQVDGKATATRVGRLYNTVNTANNLANASQNQADIAKSLERKGFNNETANDIAEALVASYNGQELNKAQEKLLESAKESKVVQDAISNIMTNEQSTMGQRSNNIRSFERDISNGLISKAINEAVANSATEKQFTPSGDYAVSKDGKATAMVTEEVEGNTITKDTGEVININGIASIRKGEMLLDIGEGKTINAKNVAYANKNDALIYESIANLGDNINAETANKLIGKYKGGDALVFARGIAQAYTYGFYGIDRSELTGKRSLTTELTEEQRNFAYGLGERYRPIKDANDKTKSVKKLAKSGKTPSEKGVYYRDKDGNATDISTYLKESNIKLNDLQKTGIEAMRKMSKMMGARFNVFESWVENGKSYYLNEDGKVVEGNPNGFYDTTTGEIYIDLNAGNDFQGTMLFTIAHEVTHFMRQWSPEHFTKIAKIVFQHGGMKGNVSELVALKQARAKAKGKPISYDVAMEEVVADGMETILKDGKVVEFMADVKKQDYAAWEKLKGWFKNLAKFLRKMVWAYSGQSAQTVEGAKVAEFSQDVLNQIERIFAEGTVAAGENYSRVESIVGQINIFLDEIMELDTVATIDSSNATPYTGNRKIDEISGRDAFKAQGGIAIRPGFGRVHIGKKGAVNTVFHGNGPAKQAAFPAIKAVIENGIEIAKDYNHDGLGFDTITFSAPIKFFDNKSPLAVVVKVFESVNADKTFYIHEICDAQGNYIQMDGTEFEQKNSSTNLVEPTSTVSAAYDGSNPNTNIHNDSEIVKSESAEALDIEVDEKTESVSPAVLNSERTWTESDYVQEREKAAKEIAKAIGVSVKKAKAYIDSVNGIAKMIAEDRVRLDYFSSPGRSSFVGNVEYGGSFDFSTLCKKRGLLTGTFTAIQKALPNTALTADDILKIRNRMKKAGLEVNCGLCYVEGSRANMGQFAKEFLKLYKQYYPDAWQPNMADVNTPDGIEWVRINHPECYEQYEYFWNHYGTLKPGDKNLFASQQKPKLYQLHTEYKGEVLEKFNNDDNVEAKNLNGGIRLQSFSDFEIVHLIDTMQIIMDMSRVGLAGQAYTKVPDFAWALGDTGLKINLSLIAKGVDENGKLIFDDVEGMPIADAMKLRDRYSKNVGTILVAFNDEQLLAAMADERVDYIIPFHRSQWKKSQYGAMGLPAKTKDYTYMQNEKFIKPQYHEYRGRMVQDKATNYMPNEYWDFSKSGKENAEAYLEMCARNNKRPKFYKLLQNNGDGSYSLKADGSTDGYWKLLIDFKMYDNDGNGSPQMPVKPEFNMDEAQRMLNDYQGGHSNFPVAQGVVDEFVQEYKDSHKGVLYSDRDNAPTFYSQMAKVVDGVKQEKLGAASVVSMLRGKGVKAEEIKWSGIEDWLEGKKSVTKAELQEFIAGSMLQIEEETLSNEEIPYTENQQKKLDEYEAKRDEVAKRLADEWKRITGEEFPIRNVGSGLESAVVNKIIDANLAKKKASFEGRLLEKLKKDVKEVIENNDDFGFDSWMDAIRSIRRHRKDFIKHYEMSTNDKAIIVKYCTALNAYNEIPNTISDADTDKLRDIAKEADVFNRKIGDVKSEHYAEASKHMTKWGQYKLKGGENYREILFKMPGSSYSNTAMDVHWDERGGVLAHARIQDLNTFLGKMLFVEEIQSDWHNEGRKDGYDSDAPAVRQKIDELAKQWDDLYEKMLEADAVAVHGINEKMDAIDAERLRLEKKVKFGHLTPDAPFRDTYHEYVLKRVLRMAAEQDYDSIGWTTAQTQVERWSKEFAEAYRIEYDQDIPKFLNKYGKKWGTQVGKTTLDNGTEVWSMAITDSMKESVMTEGQALYSDRDSSGNQLTKEQQEFFKYSKARDFDGNLRVLYHGTYEDFTVFDISKTATANAFGQGHYFTSHKKDAQENYASSDGADVGIKIESLAWLYFEEMGYTEADYESNDYISEWNEAYDKAEEYYKSGKVMQVYLNITNPLYAGRYGELYDSSGNEVTARSAEILKELGYDGIIDYKVADRFGRFQDLDEDTAHYIVFDSNQIKLTSNDTPTTDPDIRYSDRVLMGSLFSGGGTLEAGLAYQMLDKQFGVEYDGKIASVYADNHGDHIQVGKVEDFDISKYDDIFYLHASPVCHNFSNAKHGAKELQMDINSAKATAKHLETAMPQVFTVENAPGYRKSQSLKIITDKLTELGYKWDVDVYNSADYGSATSRNRVILRAVKDGELPAKPTKQERTNSWDKVTRDLWGTLPKATLRPSFISAIENTHNLPILDANGKVNVNKPLLILTTTSGHTVTYCWEGDICPTLTTKCGEARLVMPDGNIYGVTPEFMGRIQGLPDDYKYPKEKTRAFTIIGNGIPTHLTKAVVGGVLDSAYEQTHDGQVLYQDRADESVSNRSLLANAFEGLAQNDIEKNKIQEYKGKIDLINAEEKKLSELNQQIKELSFAKGPRDTKKIRGLQFEANQTANRINTYDKQLLRLEASKPLQDVLAREKKLAYQRAEKKGKEALDKYKERAAKTQRELLERWQESRKKGIESRNKTAMRHKIKDVVNELNQYLLKGTKDRHVPESLQKAVAEALNAVNMDTVGADERIAKLKAEMMKAKTPEQIQEISRKIDHIQEMGDRMNGRLKKLKDAYDELLKSPDENTRRAHDEVIHNKLESVIDKIGNTPLRDMTLAQLEDVYDMYRMVLKSIRDANKSFKDAKNQSISTRANAVMAQVEEVGGKHKLSAKILNGIKKFGWNNLKPVYAFEHIGSVTLTEAFKNVRAGEDTWALDIVEAREFYLDKMKKYQYDSWDFQKQHEFKSTSEMDFSLNLEQILSLYAYSKRDQAADHLKYGGIVFDESTKIIKKKLGIPIEFNPTEATAYNISEETLAEIIGNLTDEQKDFVDEMQDYLSTVMGAKGNEVSMAMYDIKLFKDKNYFPLKSAQQFMEKAREQQKGDVKIKNSGFSKETVPKAKNPIVLTPFMEVWSNHVNEMSMYHAFVLPLEDFYRIYNYKTPSKDETLATESVNQYIHNAYGRAATAYIDQLLNDLNGGARTDSTTGFINKMMGLFKKGSVFASLSVVVQQPSAIARAVALVDTKYFIGPKVDHKRHKALWDEVKQYAPVAIIKEMGYFDTNMGKSTQDFILSKEYSGFKEKMKALVTDSNYRDEVLSKAPALADELAWCSIWEAVKRETQAKNPGMDVKSDEFLQQAGERFTEVITKTQVYDSVLSRSGLMRSKDTGMKMATAFMAEPTTSINMIADALLQGKRGNRKYCRTAIGAVVASQILNSILVSFVYAGRDDDEDETYLEKYIGTLTGEILDSLNPATYIPFIKDIVSIVKGYDVERSDMAVISDLWKAWENLSSDKISVYRKVENFAGSIAQIFGLPVKNIMRDARGIYQTIMSFVNGQQTTGAGIGYAVKSAFPEWIGGGDVSNQDQLYEAYLSGDSAQIARVQGRFEDQSAVNTAMRSAIKSRYDAGELDDDTAMQYLVEYGGMEEHKAYWRVEEWKYETDTGEEFSQYNDFYTAVQTGKNLKAVIKEYTDHGVSNETLHGRITSYFKPLYKEMSNTERAAIKGYLLNAYTLLGYNRSEKSKDIDKWLKD